MYYWYCCCCCSVLHHTIHENLCSPALLTLHSTFRVHAIVTHAHPNLPLQLLCAGASGLSAVKPQKKRDLATPMLVKSSASHFKSAAQLKSEAENPIVASAGCVFWSWAAELVPAIQIVDTASSSFSSLKTCSKWDAAQMLARVTFESPSKCFLCIAIVVLHLKLEHCLAPWFMHCILDTHPHVRGCRNLFASILEMLGGLEWIFDGEVLCLGTF